MTTFAPKPGEWVRVTLESRVFSDGGYLGQNFCDVDDPGTGQRVLREVIEAPATIPAQDPVGTLRVWTDGTSDSVHMVKVGPNLWVWVDQGLRLDGRDLTLPRDFCDWYDDELQGTSRVTGHITQGETE